MTQHRDVDHIIDSTYGVLATPQLQRPDSLPVTVYDPTTGIRYSGRVYPEGTKVITMTEAQFNALIADAKEAGVVPMNGAEYRERYS